MLAGVLWLGLLRHVVATNTNLPVIDLGYELHQASSFNSVGQLYNFTNIRYAAPPTGALRFRAPQPPVQNRSVIQTGLPDRICPQATPAWQDISMQSAIPQIWFNGCMTDAFPDSR